MTNHLCRHPDRTLHAQQTAAPSRTPRKCRRPIARVYASSEVRRPQLRQPSTQEKGTDVSHGNGVGGTQTSTADSKQSAVTIEYQRQQAKELQRYFRQLKEEGVAERQKLFGWTSRAEIQNGRWVMFGLAVGLLTEYATGVNFVNQIKLMISYLGIADIYD